MQEGGYSVRSRELHLCKTLQDSSDSALEMSQALITEERVFCFFFSHPSERGDTRDSERARSQAHTEERIDKMQVSLSRAHIHPQGIHGCCMTQCSALVYYCTNTGRCTCRRGSRNMSKLLRVKIDDRYEWGATRAGIQSHSSPLTLK